jgi:Ca2+-binding EF-hand superfamily protein
MARQNARRAKKSSTGETGASYIEFKEFRMLLVYIHQYFEYLMIFDQIDTSDDRRIDFNEFKNALGLLAQAGVRIPARDAAAVFAEIDDNGGGTILFDEFAEWAFHTNLDVDPCDDDDEKCDIIPPKNHY